MRRKWIYVLCCYFPCEILPPTQVQLIFCGCVYQCGNGLKRAYEWLLAQWWLWCDNVCKLLDKYKRNKNHRQTTHLIFMNGKSIFTESIISILQDGTQISSRTHTTHISLILWTSKKPKSMKRKEIGVEQKEIVYGNEEIQRPTQSFENSVTL